MVVNDHKWPKSDRKWWLVFIVILNNIDTYPKMFRYAVTVIPDLQSVGHRLQLKVVHVKIPPAIDAYANDTWILLMVDMFH